MKIAFEKRQRMADIFAKVAEYTVLILIFGSIISDKRDILILSIGLGLFIFFFIVSIIAEPLKEDEK